MRRFLILTTILIITLSSCFSVGNAVSGSKGGEKLASSIFSGGADGWAAAGMLRSPVAGIHAAGAVYGVLTLIVLIMNVTDSVQGMMESEGELPARGQFRAPGIGSKLPIRQ